ncbi:unnamed protein product [Kuraishia capsulata CBS 1993]|uniref:Uncharacterized protein n=1 Tax=Kuraishia capsulata CBS 1993 TaxID=1382522 RepID=W6MID0_9ASCO|nr:unnamed protein product [Kuraishia capsulata CBS 1993]
METFRRVRTFDAFRE